MIEIKGVGIIAMGMSLGPYLTAELKTYIASIVPDDWYPTDKYGELIKLLNGQDEKVVKTVGRSSVYGAKAALEGMGIDSPEKAIMSMGPMFQSFYRGGDIGEFNVKMVGENNARITDTTKFFDERYTHGLIEGNIAAFGGRVVKLERLESREDGAAATVFIVEWSMK